LTHTSQSFGGSAVFSQRYEGVVGLYDLTGTAGLIWQRCTCSPRDVRAYAAAAAAADTSLQAGCIVEFKTDSRQDLALLQRPNGKANWFATDVRQASSKAFLYCASWKSEVLHLLI